MIQNFQLLHQQKVVAGEAELRGQILLDKTAGLEVVELMVIMVELEQQDKAIMEEVQAVTMAAVEEVLVL